MPMLEEARKKIDAGLSAIAARLAPSWNTASARVRATLGPTVASARATIKTVSADGSTLAVHTRTGEDQTIHLNPKTRFILVVPAALAAHRDPRPVVPQRR